MHTYASLLKATIPAHCAYNWILTEQEMRDLWISLILPGAKKSLLKYLSILQDWCGVEGWNVGMCWRGRRTRRTGEGQGWTNRMGRGKVNERVLQLSGNMAPAAVVPTAWREFAWEGLETALVGVSHGAGQKGRAFCTCSWPVQFSTFFVVCHFLYKWWGEIPLLKLSGLRLAALQMDRLNACDLNPLVNGIQIFYLPWWSATVLKIPFWPSPHGKHYHFNWPQIAIILKCEWWLINYC